MKTKWIIAMAVATLPAWGAEPEALRCRTLADAAARLACYDAWVDAQRSAAPAGDARPAGAAVAVTASARAAASDPAGSFGLEHKLTANAVEVIESRIPGAFEGWDPGATFTFANGQIWQIVDGSRAVYFLHEPRVRVRRGVFGAFYLEVEGVNQSPRVRRLR